MEREVYPMRRSQAASTKDLHDAGPGARDVAPVVAAAAETEDAALRVAVGDRAESRCRMGMRRLGEPEMGDRVAGQAVGAALQDHELGCVPFEM